MRYALSCLLFLCLFYAACNGDGGKELIPAADQQKTAIKAFSDTTKADTFKVVLDGSRPKEIKLVFSITSFEGKQIYKTSIKAADLFKNYDATINLNKEKNQIKFLQEEMNRFFDEENFMEPAVTEQESPDQYVPDKAFYQELKSSRRNGFSYRLGKENKVYIAWSGTAKKVKPYYICCK